MISLTTTDGCQTVVQVAADENTTTADLGIIGTGVSRCNPSDVFDAELGQGIALGRAIEDFGRQVTEAYNRRVVTKDEYARVLDNIARDPSVAMIRGLRAGDQFMVTMEADHMHVEPVIDLDRIVQEVLADLGL